MLRASLFLIGIMLASHAAARSLDPEDKVMISRISQRFRLTFDRSGINGVGKDVLKCYGDSLGNDDATKECVVYDLAALIFDRQMQQIFAARGMDVPENPLYTNKAFDARSYTYGFPAFHGNEAEKKLVAQVARRVIDKAFPH